MNLGPSSNFQQPIDIVTINKNILGQYQPAYLLTENDEKEINTSHKEYNTLLDGNATGSLATTEAILAALQNTHDSEISSITSSQQLSDSYQITESLFQYTLKRGDKGDPAPILAEAVKQIEIGFSKGFFNGFGISGVGLLNNAKTITNDSLEIININSLLKALSDITRTMQKAVLSSTANMYYLFTGDKLTTYLGLLASLENSRTNGSLVSENIGQVTRKWREIEPFVLSENQVIGIDLDKVSFKRGPRPNIITGIETPLGARSFVISSTTGNFSIAQEGAVIVQPVTIPD